MGAFDYIFDPALENNRVSFEEIIYKKEMYYFYANAKSYMYLNKVPRQTETVEHIRIINQMKTTAENNLKSFNRRSYSDAWSTFLFKKIDSNNLDFVGWYQGRFNVSNDKLYVPATNSLEIWSKYRGSVRKIRPFINNER